MLKVLRKMDCLKHSLLPVCKNARCRAFPGQLYSLYLYEHAVSMATARKENTTQTSFPVTTLSNLLYVAQKDVFLVRLWHRRGWSSGCSCSSSGGQGRRTKAASRIHKLPGLGGLCSSVKSCPAQEMNRLHIRARVFPVVPHFNVGGPELFALFPALFGTPESIKASKHAGNLKHLVPGGP